MRPDRVVIGADDERAIAAMRAVYAPFQRNHERLLVMDVRSAELTKYAANAMLATRISFMNELANLADAAGRRHRAGAPGHRLRSAHRLPLPVSGRRATAARCFPKDVKALQHTATAARPAAARCSARSRRSTRRRSCVLVDKIVARLGEDLAGPHVRAVGPRVQAQHRRHARGAGARDHRGARRARRARRRLRPGRDATRRSACSATRRTLRFAASPMAALARRRRAGRRHRVEGIPQPRFRRAARAAASSRWSSTAATCTTRRWCARAGLEYFAHRTPVTDAGAADGRVAAFPHAASASPQARVLVVGDVMLDRYWFGDVERISPEAPVPVVQDRAHRGAPRRRRQRRAQRRGARRAGDAAVGRRRRRGRRDARAAARRRAACARRSTAMPTLPTTVKLRVIGRQQQLLRIDFETAPSHEVLAPSSPTTSALLPDCRRRVLSDYGKGGLAHIATMIERARAAGKPVLVDPKGEDCARYRGATLLTPNRGEFRAGGRPLARRGRADRARRRRCARELDARRAAGHALGGGHEPLHGGRRASTFRRRRARCTTCPAPATR